MTCVSVSIPDGIVVRKEETQETVFFPFCHLHVQTDGQLDDEVNEDDADTNGWEEDDADAKCTPFPSSPISHTLSCDVVCRCCLCCCL